MRLVHLTTSPATHESRLMKETWSLLKCGLVQDVVIIGNLVDGLAADEKLAENIKVIRRMRPLSKWPANPLIGLAKRIAYTSDLVKVSVALSPDLVIPHSINTLEAAVKIKRRTGCPVIYDCHEWETETPESVGLRRTYLKRLERKYIAEVDGVMTASASIAEKYVSDYGITRPTVLRPIPDSRWQDVETKSSNLRASLKISESDLLFLYLGLLAPGRRCEEYIEIFKTLPSDRHLVFMGYGDLKETIIKAASSYPNIHFHPAVAPNEVLSFARAADVGLVGVQQICLSNYFTLPNKSLEYLQAGIASVSPKFPEMQRIVQDTKSGWVHEDNEADLRTVIESITKEAAILAGNNAKLHRHHYSWENEEKGLIALVQKVLREMPVKNNK